MKSQFLKIGILIGAFGIAVLVGFHQSCFAEVYFDISMTPCSRYFQENFGVHASKLCSEGQTLYLCTSSKPPFGAEVPEQFFKEFKIDRSNLQNSLTASCYNIKEAELPKIAENCHQSDHVLFQPLLNRIGVPLHTCFCELGKNPVLSICRQSNGEWKSTMEFETNRAHQWLSEICRAQQVTGYEIACFCNKHYGENPDNYLNCLKEKTQKTNVTPVSTKPSPARGAKSAR